MPSRPLPKRCLAPLLGGVERPRYIVEPPFAESGCETWRTEAASLELPSMRRRALLPLFMVSFAAPLLAVVSGCSKNQKTAGFGPNGKRPKGPQTMGNLMVDAWRQDLGDKVVDKRIRAARELGNMGPAAKSALPALRKAAGDTNKEVAAAAKAAIASIGKK